MFHCVVSLKTCMHVFILLLIDGMYRLNDQESFYDCRTTPLLQAPVKLFVALRNRQTDILSCFCKWFPCSLTSSSLFGISFYWRCIFAVDLQFFFVWKKAGSRTKDVAVLEDNGLSWSNEVLANLYHLPHLAAAQQLSAFRERLISLRSLSFDR